MNKKKELTLADYKDCMPTILVYQLLSKVLLITILKVHSGLVGLLLWNLGRPAFTSGDLPFLLRSWQGWGLLLAGILVLWLYTVFDINATVNICERIVHNREYPLADILVETFHESLKLISPMGLAVLVFVGILAPLCGAAFGISLTSSFVIPEFILSVINDSWFLHALYLLTLGVLLAVAFFGMFTFHGVLIGHESVGTSYRQSVKMIRAHFRDFLWRYIRMTVQIWAAYFGFVLVLYVLPVLLANAIPMSVFLRHTVIICATILLELFTYVWGVLYSFAFILKLTMLYEEYRSGEAVNYTAPPVRHRRLYRTAVLVTLAGIIGISALLALDFEGQFPKVADTMTVAHRGGGDLANENTILGLEAAIDAGAEYSEIDVQRTKDGAYIINHDKTFQRTAGDPHKPQELDLIEIRQLEVVNAADPTKEKAPVATIGEFLESADGRIGLLVELKGSSADHQMAEDLVAMIQAYGMTDQVVLISLDYGILEYAKTICPEILTGYLCYFGFGDIGRMNCDYLLLEAETATPQNIRRIHADGKKVGVWTVNTTDAMLRFYNSEVDFIITDKVDDAHRMKALITSERDEIRILNAFNLK